MSYTIAGVKILNEYLALATFGSAGLGAYLVRSPLAPRLGSSTQLFDVDGPVISAGYPQRPRREEGQGR